MGCTTSKQPNAGVAPNDAVNDVPPTPQEDECEGCFTDHPVKNFTITCEDGHKACDECVANHIRSEINAGNFGPMPCINTPGCKAVIAEYIVKARLSRQEYRRYDDIRTRKAFGALDGIVPCPKCGVPMGENPRLSYATCEAPGCRFQFCLTCKHKWHPGEQCEKAKERHQAERADEERATRKFLLEETEARPCPKCGQMVEKIKGCEHMTCTCGQEFCMLCGVERSPIMAHGVHYHAPSCLFHKQCCNDDCLKDVDHTQAFDVRCKLDKPMLEGEYACDLCKKTGKLCAPPADVDRAAALGFTSSEFEPSSSAGAPAAGAGGPPGGEDDDAVVALAGAEPAGDGDGEGRLVDIGDSDLEEELDDLPAMAAVPEPAAGDQPPAPARRGRIARPPILPGGAARAAAPQMEEV